jgi:hypothetical protein
MTIAELKIINFRLIFNTKSKLSNHKIYNISIYIRSYLFLTFIIIQSANRKRLPAMSWVIANLQKHQKAQSSWPDYPMATILNLTHNAKQIASRYYNLSRWHLSGTISQGIKLVDEVESINALRIYSWNAGYIFYLLQWIQDDWFIVLYFFYQFSPKASET